VASIHNRKKQLWQIYGGQGKSRIMAAAGAHALTKTIISHVHFVFPTAHLMERDKGLYIRFFDLMDLEEKVHYYDNLDFDTEKGDLVIIDEVDHFIYDDP